MKQFCLSIVFLLASSVAFATSPIPAGAFVDAGFSPDGGALDVVLKGINSARSSILVAAYTFTSRPVAAALVSAHKRGVRVAVIADMEQNSKAYSGLQYLANQGIPVRRNAHFLDLHDKFMVIDAMHVETGSFNYSSAATKKNAENVLLLWNVDQLAGMYASEWQKLWQGGQDMQGQR